MPEYASRRLVFCWGSAMRLPDSIVSVASSAATGIQLIAWSPAPSKNTRNSATNPAAFGVTLNQATNGVDAASYVSGTHMWNGNAAILNAKPASAATRPSVSSGPALPATAAILARSVLPVAPYTNDNPYASIAEETEPTSKNFSEASTATASLLRKPAST